METQVQELKKPTEKDLKKIASKVKSLAKTFGEGRNRFISNLYFFRIGKDLGFELDEDDNEKIFKLVEARLEKEAVRKQKLFEKKFQKAILAIWPACQDCGSKELKARFSSHSQYSDRVIIGGPNFDRHWETLDHLYCSNCGRVYYTEKVKELEKRWERGEFSF